MRIRHIKTSIRIPLLLVMIVSAMLAACAVRRQSAEFTTIPEVGAVATRGVGEHLLTKGINISDPVLIVPNDLQIANATIPKGEYPIHSENAITVNYGAVALIEGKKSTFWFDKGQRLFCVARDQCTTIEHRIELRLTKKIVTSFQQTLLYNGKIGNRITLAYREFDKGMARTAFSNEVAYDLDESKVLGYKGARLEVIRATNTEITYKVLSGFE